MISKLTLCAILAMSAAGIRPERNQPLQSAADRRPHSIHGEPVYLVGEDVIAPRAIIHPDPEYSEEARLARLQGTCLLSLVVGTDGKPEEVRVVHSLGLGLDEKSVEAVRAWRFEAGTKNGQRVAVEIHVETSFRLFTPGLPVALDGEALPLPQKYAADYPLLIDLRFVRGTSLVDGYCVTAEGSVIAGGQPDKAVALTCGPKGKCFMLQASKYPARRLSSTEMELLGRNEDDGKLQKAQFSVHSTS